MPVTLYGLGVNLFISRTDKFNTVVHHFVFESQVLKVTISFPTVCIDECSYIEYDRTIDK